MILNLLHRPSPGESYPFYQLQQQMAHELGLKVTVLVPPDALLDSGIVAGVRRDAATYGDELGIWFDGLASLGLGEENFIWLYPQEIKQRIVERVLDLFRQAFGREPAEAGAYHLDANTMRFLKAACPELKVVVGGCFEEGVKVFHGCNNSWYLFNEGMPWGPWYPSATHALRPAQDEADWAGLVAVPHLSRDLVLSYEGRNDFFASHPANVQRAMGNEGLNCPYNYNLVDQYRLQEDFNDGYSYYNVHVSAGWLNKHPTIQDTSEVSQQLYRDLLEYFIALRGEGKLVDMTMSEFAGWFRQNVPIQKPHLNLAKEILYGSGKQYFWYLDSFFRVVVDTAQAGSIGDLRPYAGQVPCITGPDTPSMMYGSYPYLIHSQYRSGISHHFADGARTTLFVTHQGEILDLALCKTHVSEVCREGTVTILRLTLAELSFKSGLTASIETTLTFLGNGKIEITRRLAACSDPQAVLAAQEVFKGCWGVTEYPEDLHGVELGLEDDLPQLIEYEYLSRTLTSKAVLRVWARLPQVSTQVTLEPVSGTAAGEVVEGFLFNPYFTLKLEMSLSMQKESRTCLTIAKLS